ncbi:MAG TPA: hypothetical protein VFZ83_04255 [Acidimicrobiia bacterium]|nr:hypothetical protein [Acidimicrobiia bacterium]
MSAIDDAGRDDTIDPSDELALRASLRAEWRAEQEALIDDAAEEWRHQRTLAEVARECMHRGDRVRVVVRGHQLHGEVLEVGHDLLSLRTATGRVDVHLDASVPVLVQPERAKSGGARDVAGAGSFRSALLARETNGPVVLGTTIADDALEGRLVVGHDHVCVIDDERETFVPISAITFVGSRSVAR